MQKLRKLALVTALTLSFAGTIYADDGLPCAPPVPGQTNTPPCSMAQLATDDNLVPNATSGLAPANVSTEYSIAELTLDVVESLLTLF